jgi:hypothetical protein
MAKLVQGAFVITTTLVQEAEETFGFEVVGEEHGEKKMMTDQVGTRSLSEPGRESPPSRITRLVGHSSPRSRGSGNNETPRL